MKNLNTLIMTTTLLVTSLASAGETSWVTTPFWKAPTQTELELKLEPKKDPTRMLRACNSFKKEIKYYKKGILEFTNERLESMRKEVWHTDRTSEFDYFAIYFNVLGTDKFGNYKFLNSATNNEVSALPGFIQQTSSTKGNLLDGGKFEVIVLDKTSDTEFMRSQGLKDSEVTIEEWQGQTAVQFKGIDVLCDFLENKVSLVFKTNSRTVIEDKNYYAVEDFYNNKIAKVLTKTLSGQESDIRKAMRLGYKFGAAIESTDARPSPEETEKQVMQLMDTLFVPGTLKTSSVVTGEKNKQIEVPGLVEHETKITFGL